MKNFYEATVIKPKLTTDILLNITPVGSLPCLVKINGSVVYEDMLSEEITLEYKNQLTNDITIEVQVDRKHPEAVELTLSIDGYNILPLYQHLTSHNTCYIDFNNTWQFSIPSFYPWYHGITGQGWIS